MLARRAPMARTQMRRTPKKRAPAAVQRYWNALPHGCAVCGDDAVLHHLLAEAPGKASRRDHWFVVKLCPNHHNMGTHSVHGLGSEAAFERVTGVDLVALAVRNRENFLGAMEVF